MAFNFKEILTNLIIEDSRYDVLMKKYTEPKKKGKKAQMDKELLTSLMLADPTSKIEGTNTADEDTREVEKVGAYTNWLIKQWLGLQQKADAEHDYGTPEWNQKLERLQELFIEDLYKVTEDLEKFHYLKKTKKYKGQKDIGQIKSVEDLYDNVKDYQVSKDEITKTKAERLRDDVDKVYEDDKWLILVPKSKEASCHYGGGQTRWCTASKSSNYYDHYAKQGPLYMMMYKEDAGKPPAENRSHQFHFESNSFYNAQDRSIDLGSFFATYPELKPFFKEKNQEIPSNLSFQINNSKLENFKISYNNIFAELLSLENLVGYINFSGKQSKIPDSNINLMGTINEFNLDEWKNLSSDNDINYLSYVNKADVFFKKFVNDKLIMDNLKIKGYSTKKIFLFNEISAINNYLQLKASGNVEFNNISTFKINLNTKNLENLLNYWNFNHSLRDASMKSDLDISWKGGLFDFSLKGAYGKFSTNMKDGRLKKVGNRATRIFGLFNIDLLAKRLSLDFDDVTKNGFYFNSLNGDFRLDSGNIFTTNLLIKGPSAELLTVGTTNFIDETYDMQVIASPEFGETLPAIALLGGPITAAATFAAEKLAKAFGRDINDLIKIKYKVSGTWDEPKIKIINKKTDALDDVEELFE